MRRALVACAFVLGGCSLVFANNLDDADAPRPDASVPAEASPPAPAVDAGDAGPFVEAGPPPPIPGCAGYRPTPKFCLDFDDGRSLASAVTTVDRSAGDSVIDSTFFHSAPNAAKVTIATNASCQYSRFEQRFYDLSGKRLAVSFRFRPVGPWRRLYAPFVLTTSDADKYCAALFYVESKNNDGVIDSAAINMQSNALPNHVVELDGFPQVDRWTEVTFDVRPRDGGGLTHAITMTSESGAARTSVREFPECAPFNQVTMYAGFHCASGTGTAYYDDLRADWE